MRRLRSDDEAPSRTTASDATRWGQLIFGIICMVMIANLQYGWTLFVNPIDQKYHWGRAAIQVAFTIFVLTETWLVPFEGYLIAGDGDKHTAAADHHPWSEPIACWQWGSRSAPSQRRSPLRSVRPRRSGNHFSALPTEAP